MGRAPSGARPFSLRRLVARTATMRHYSYIAFALLAACGSGQPVPTDTENAQLDEAANMLDRADDNLANADDAQLPTAEPDASDQ